MLDHKISLPLTPLEANELEIALFDWLHTANEVPRGLKQSVFPIAHRLRNALTSFEIDVAIERFDVWFGVESFDG